ncbi:cytochrome c oxidase accessory protein CcoG [Spartinivicinus ruber]|uniref:cytochrome c oxidase accessory protein CcoG n=1 Tax=Spartinivicinus ruber TaxID=2683272 RepID=UPI0013D81785|nr:cytochrome c oxidase accessory protein CcoG [Spartinivicinus ruber]
MSTSPINEVKPDKSELIEVVDLYQKREKVYTRAFKGVYRNLRIIGGAFLFILYFGTVWIPWGDRQAILFDLPARQFHIFSVTFWPQDMILLSSLLIICAFGLFFITVLAGRIWCGYTCPQSVFTWVFMWAEKITEGDRNKRMKLDKAEMGISKFRRKFLKHTLWLMISLATGITFVGYFTPINTLVIDLVSGAANSWAYFWVGFFTLATYGNAGWLREQVCIYMCPYARFQSVMFDENTLIVSYDPNRGETRGPRKRDSDYKTKGLGDCIDCQMCVQVCPTGIDIRDGLQYECIGCAACIDACDNIMEKMNYPKGLIRYTTENSLAGKATKILRPSLLGYLSALLIISGFFSYTLLTRVPVTLEISRDRNTLYNETSRGTIENVYMLKIGNMDQHDHPFKVTVSGIPGIKLSEETKVIVPTGEVKMVPVRLELSPDKITSRNMTFSFKIVSQDSEHLAATQESRFIAPTDPVRLK